MNTRCSLSYIRLYYIENSHQQDNSWCVYIRTANALKRLRKLQLCLDAFNTIDIFPVFFKRSWIAIGARLQKPVFGDL